MALIIGQNSWVTLTEAETYLTDKMEVEDWFTLSDSANPGAVSKTTLLISAFYWLLNSAQVELSATLTDVFVKNAQIEAAWYLYQHNSALNNRQAAMSQGVEEFRLSRKREQLNIKNLTIPSHILGMLKNYSVQNTFVELKGHYDLG